jgi:hypothetical protein
MVRRVEASEIMTLPWESRRIIVVTDKVPAVAAASSSSWGEVLLSALPLRGGKWIFGGLLGAAAFKLIADARRQFRDAGEALTAIDSRAAEGLNFPPGHPRKNVVYVAHPVDAGYYIPAADFHRFLFQHKVAEAQRLVRSLGAIDVQVVHIQGWDRNAAASLGISLPQAAPATDLQVGAEANRTDKKGQQVLMTMKLAPTREPRVPGDLVWTPHEPLWKEVADARMESGLSEFTIDVSSSDDYGVNASMKALIQKTGLDAGGKFVDHQETIWRLTGTFS